MRTKVETSICYVSQGKERVFFVLAIKPGRKRRRDERVDFFEGWWLMNFIMNPVKRFQILGVEDLFFSEQGENEAWLAEGELK